MSFLAPILLLLSGLASIPFLLHLIRRKRMHNLYLPTFRYLKKAATEQHLHLRLQDRLLLILRVLLILLVALAFAGPQSQNNVPVDSPHLSTRNYLILDDSLSMAAKGNGKTYYEEAVQKARLILSQQPKNWQAALLSETNREFPLDYQSVESFLKNFPTLPSTSGCFTLDSFSTWLDQDIPDQSTVWLLTDQTRSPWEGFLNREKPLKNPVFVLTSRIQPQPPNWYIKEFQIHNQPLLPGEPVFLSVWYGTDKPVVEGNSPPVQITWKDSSEPVPHTETITASTTSPPYSLVEMQIPTKGILESLQMEILTGQTQSDPLPEDNQLSVLPHSVSSVRFAVLAQDPLWQRLFSAALDGHEMIVVDPSSRFTQALDADVYFLVLSSRTPDEGWRNFLGDQLNTGKGIILFYDIPGDNPRLSAWNNWLAPLGLSLKPALVESRENILLAGSSTWFLNNLDSTGRDLKWAEQMFYTNVIDGMTSELLIQPRGRNPFPLFQTRKVGNGLLASWNVPLDLRNTNLVYAPAFIPILYQMIKRSLIKLDETAQGIPHQLCPDESDLSVLDTKEIESLRRLGIVFVDPETTLAEGSLPQIWNDWTMLILIACLLLGLVEIGISNYI